MNSLEINKQYKLEKKQAQRVLKINNTIKKTNEKKQQSIKLKAEQKASQKSFGVKKTSQKKRTVKKIYKENVELAKKIAKERDKRTCQWCGSKSNIQGSHIINEASDHRLSTNEDNIKALCYHCHLNVRHKNPLLAHERFTKKFPGRFERLQNLHIEYSKMGTIGRERHEKENERLKKLLK